MQIQTHCKCKYKSKYSTPAHNTTLASCPKPNDPVPEQHCAQKYCAYKFTNIPHTFFTNTVHFHFVTHRYYQSASQYSRSTTRKHSSHREWNPAPVEAQRLAPVLIGSLQSPLSFSGRLIANMFHLQYSLWPWRSSSSWPKPKFKSSWSWMIQLLQMFTWSYNHFFPSTQEAENSRMN